MGTSLFNTKKTDTTALNVVLNIGKNPSKWEQWFLLRSDAHHDNIKCDQKMEKRHLDEALERNAGIIDVGDLFCAMQGKYDKRSDKSACRPEHQVTDYFDALVRTAADFYQPYAKNFLTIGHGNHETAVLNRHEVDLTQRLIARLNDRTGSNIHSLGYEGWIRFQIKRGHEGFSKVLWYTHGYGGGGPVTEDMIQSNRQRVWVENADIMVSGHAHRSWVQEFIKEKMNQRGNIERRCGFYIKTPTYKDSHSGQRLGFEKEKGHGPRPLGAYWLRLYYRAESIQMQVIKAN